MTTGPRLSRVGAIAAAALLVLWIASAAHAATTFTVNTLQDTVGGDCSGGGTCSIRDAIDAANADPGDNVIALPTGRIDLSIAPDGTDDNSTGDLNVANAGTLTIQGPTGDPKDSTISANGLDRVLDIASGGNVTLTGVTIQDGLVDAPGAGIFAESNSTLTLNTTRVVKNVSTQVTSIGGGGTGGGILGAFGSTITLNGSHVDNNNAFYYGGGIEYFGDLTLTDSTVNGNTATEDYGGGIYDGGTSLNATRTTIANNVAANSDGGGIYHELSLNVAKSHGVTVATSDVTLTDSHLDNNLADSGYGGGIDNETGNLTLTRTSASGNKAWGEGGAVYNDGDSLTIQDSPVENNWAAIEGGGVSSENGPTSIKGGSVSGNQSMGAIVFPIFQVGAGGGVYNDGNSLTVDGTDVSNNSATGYDGGGIANESGDLSVSNATVNGNKTGSLELCLEFIFCTDAGTSGGGIYNNGGNVTLANSQVNDNFAEAQGGGVYNNGFGLTITSTSIDRNLARNGSTDSVSAAITSLSGGAGAGIWHNGDGDLSLTDSHVDDNKATNDNAGGIYSNSGDLGVTHTSVDGNFADGNGGGIDNNGNSTSVVDSSVSKNIAYDSGAGLYEDSGTSTITNSTIADNQADLAPGYTIEFTAGHHSGGGIYNENADSMTLTNVTLAGNLSDNGDGGGIYSNKLSVDLKNTILADNQANGTSGTNNCGGSDFQSQGNNIDGKDECSLDGTGSNGDQINTDPRLGQLQDNGGPTLTRALSDDSPAIDKGDDAACHDPVGDHDQRQAPRPIGAHCDVGAYEAFALGDLSISKDASPSPVGTNSDLTYTLHVTNNGPDKLQNVSVSDPVPAGVTFKSVNTDRGSCDNSVGCGLGAMAPGDTATITIVVHTGNSAGTVTNTATVQGNPTDNGAAAPTNKAPVGVAPADPDTSNNSATVQTQVVAPGQAPTKVTPPPVGPTITPGPKACSTNVPRSSISRPALHASSSALSFIGRTIDRRCVAALGIKKIQVAVAFKAGSKCRWLTKSGQLTGPRSCSRPTWLTAHRGKLRNGKVPWTFRVRNLHLPAGSYVVEARGIDSHNDVEKKLRTYNRKTFRIH